MIPRSTPQYLRSFFATACAMLAVDAVLPSAAFAATTPAPAPTISVSGKVVEGEPVVTTAAPAASGGRAGAPGASGATRGGGIPGRGAGGSSANTSKSDTKTYVEFVVRNTDRALPATGLTVNWHVYTKTSTMSGSTSSITMQDISGTKSIDSLAPNGSETFNSDTVDKTVSTSSSGGGSSGGAAGFGGRGGSFGGRGGSTGGGASSVSSTVTSLDGFYIEVLFNGKVIKKSSTDPKDKYDSYVKLHPGN